MKTVLQDSLDLREKTLLKVFYEQLKRKTDTVVVGYLGGVPYVEIHAGEVPPQEVLEK